MLTRLRASARALLALRYQAEIQPYNRLFEADKRQYLSELASRSEVVSTFVETGTYFGKTTQQLAKVCDQVITVEIDQVLYERAVDLFRDDNRVTVLQGDSADVLPKVLAELDRPALFWLDGHFSGGVTGGPKEPPILSELEALLQHPIKDHIIVIDDARLFRGRGGYPRLKTIAAMLQGTGYVMVIQFDLIRIQRQDFVQEL